MSSLEMTLCTIVVFPTSTFSFHYHVEVNPFVCSVSQWAGFYTVETSVMKELILI